MINAMILAYESCKDRFDKPITIEITGSTSPDLLFVFN